jgi:hypothetical protein
MKSKGKSSYDCTDPTINLFFAGVHSIRKAEHDELIENYFGINPPAGYPRTKSQIDVANLDSCEYFIRVSSAGDSPNDNSDITVTVEPGTPSAKRSKKKSAFESYYSINVFLGIIHAYDPDGYEFSKATEGNNSFFVFKVIKNKKAVYHGDLTSQFPR